MQGGICKLQKTIDNTVNCGPIHSYYRQAETDWGRLITPFRSYCMTLYDIGIWKHFTVTALNKFRSCYNRCIKNCFGYNRSDRSGVLMLLKLPSADTIVHNSRRLFVQQCVMSCSSIVQ